MSVANIGMLQGPFRRHSRRAAKSLRNKRVFSQSCKVGFYLEVPSFPLAAYIGQLQEEIHHTVQKGCEITSQQKGDDTPTLGSLACKGINKIYT